MSDSALIAAIYASPEFTVMETSDDIAAFFAEDTLTRNTWNDAENFIENFHRTHSTSSRGVDRWSRGYTEHFAASVPLASGLLRMEITRHELATGREKITLTKGDDTLTISTNGHDIADDLAAAAADFFA